MISPFIPMTGDRPITEARSPPEDTPIETQCMMGGWVKRIGHILGELYILHLVDLL